MKLLVGMIAYLAAAMAVVGAGWVGLSAVGHYAPQESPVLAMGTDGHSAKRERVIEDEVKDDPNRVPIWIAPTPKYTYTPVPIEPPKHAAVIVGKEARGAMATVPRRSKTRPERRIAEGSNPPVRVVYSSRDNDPFFRD